MAVSVDVTAGVLGHRRTTRAARGRLPEVIGAAVFAALSAWASLVHAQRFADSSTYIGVRLGGERTPTVPLLYAVLHTDPARVAAQTALSIAAWAYLAFAATARLRSSIVRWSTFALVLLVALARSTTEWNVMILSESLTVTLGIAFLAVCLSAFTRPTRKLPTALAVLGLLFAFARPEAALVLLITSLAVAGAAIAARRRALQLASIGMAAGAVIACGLAVHSARVHLNDGRSVERDNTVAIIVDRVLMRPAETRWFSAHGLRLSAAELAAAGHYAGTGTDRSFIADPSVRSFIDNRWPTLYPQYLATHLHDGIVQPAQEAPQLLSVGSVDGGRPRAIPGIDRLTWWLFVGRRELEVLAVLGVSAAVALGSKRGLGAERFIALGAIATGGLWYYLAWMGAADDLERLSAPAGILLRVGLLLMLATSIDVAAARDGRRPDITER